MVLEVTMVRRDQHLTIHLKTIGALVAKIHWLQVLQPHWEMDGRVHIFKTVDGDEAFAIHNGLMDERSFPAVLLYESYLLEGARHVGYGNESK